MQNLIVFKLVCSLLPDAFILCFSGSKSKKVISKLNQDGVSQNMAAITQHAIVEKRVGEGMFFPFFSHTMPHMCCDMQNKLSKTRVSPLGSMG